jgi:hypothetical protein
MSDTLVNCQADNCPGQPAANELLCARHWSLIPKLWQDRWLVALKDRRGSRCATITEKSRILKWEFHCESCLLAICRRLECAGLPAEGGAKGDQGLTAPFPAAARRGDSESAGRQAVPSKGGVQPPHSKAGGEGV